MSTEQPEAPALPFAPPPDCDAAEWGGAATVYGGRCRCIVCARCGHHVANSAQGHHWDWCTVTRSMRVPHFCCPDPAFGCELEAPAPEPLIMAADEFAATRKVAEALTAVGRGLELAAPFHDADRQIIAAARQALRVLGGEEADAGPGEAIVETMGPLPVAALDREHVQDLIAAALDESVGRCARCKVCDSQINAVMHAIWPLLEGAGYWHKRWTAALERADEDGVQIISQHVRIGELERRAEAAEAKLAAIERQCGKATEALRRGTGIPLRQQDVMVDARYILEIIGTEGGCDHA